MFTQFLCLRFLFVMGFSSYCFHCESCLPGKDRGKTWILMLDKWPTAMQPHKKITLLYIIIKVNQNFTKVIKIFNITFVSQISIKLTKHDLKSELLIIIFMHL